MSDFLEVLAPWATYARKEREKREQARIREQMLLEQERLSKEQQEEFARQRAQTEMVEAQRQRVVGKLTELEALATTALNVLGEVRKLLETPALSGDQIMEEAEKDLADLEKGIVQVQSMVVVDPATTDTSVLAESYASAQSGIVAVNAVMVRANGLKERLKSRIKQIEIEKIRAQEAQVKAQAAAATEERRLRYEQQQREREFQAQLDREKSQREFAILQRSQELDAAIARERQLLLQARAELERAKAEAQQKAIREAELAQKRAAYASMRPM